MVIRGTGSDSGDSDGSDNEVDPYVVMEDGLLHTQPPGHPLARKHHDSLALNHFSYVALVLPPGRIASSAS